MQESAAIAGKLRLGLMYLGCPCLVVPDFVGLDVGGDHLGHGPIGMNRGRLFFNHSPRADGLDEGVGFEQQAAMRFGFTPRA